MEGFIYKITNKVNGKSYIGQTRNTVEFRWRQHVKAKDNKYFHRAIQKYGKENFTVETLEKCKVEDLDSREIYYIAEYDTLKNGYNMTKGGSAYVPNKRGSGYVVVDDKYDEIRDMYLAGYSTHKISSLYNVDRHVISNVLKSLGVKLKHNTLNINNQELQEIIRDYNSGCSLKELARRYDCSSPGMKDFLIRKGVKIKDKYSILDDEDAQKNLIKDYLSNEIKLSEIQKKYHCSYKVFNDVLEKYNVSKKGNGGRTKLNKEQCLKVIDLFNEHVSVQNIANIYKVDKCTIYAVLKRYNIDYKKI